MSGGEATGPAVRAVLLDFYGTLGESTWAESWFAELLAEHGYAVAEGGGLSSEAFDGEEHDEHSVSEAAYRAWMRSRWTALLRSSGVPEDADAALLAAIDERRATWQMEAYPDVIPALAELRARGLRVVVCSNWDWDLDHQLALAGIVDLVDARVSSAWVGARKPHPRMFHAAVAAAGVDVTEAVFAGDNWDADVRGALDAGLRAVHVWRGGGGDEALPELPSGVVRVTDLRGLIEVL